MSDQVRRWADPEIFRLVDLAGRVDVSGFEDDYRAGGGVPYDPRLMLVTVWWCHKQGMRGPQDMARACREQVSLRAVWQRDQVPSASALRRFVGEHRQGWQRVSVSLLACCEQGGLVDVSLTATDSTPMAAPAALSRTLSAAQITVVIDETERELAALREQLTDLADEDVAGFVELGCGPLRRAEQLLLVRLQRLRRAEATARDRGAARREQGLARVARCQQRVAKHTADLSVMIDRQTQALAAYQEKVAAGRKPRGPAPRPPEQHPNIRQKTEALRRARIRLAAATEQAGSHGGNRDGPTGRANITDPDSRILKGKNTVRWVLGRLLTVTVTVGQVIVAALLSPAGNDCNGLLPNLAATAANCRQAGITAAFGHHLADAGFASPHALSNHPPIDGELLVAITNDNEQTRDPTHATATATEHRQQMAARLNTPEGKTLYRRRTPMIEPVFAHLLRTDRRLHTRGSTQHTEILAMTTSYNAAKHLKYAPRQKHPPQRGT